MPTMKLNKRSVGRLPAPDPSGKQTLYWDEELPSFGVLVSGTTAVRTYVAQHRIRGLGGKHRRVTIGRVDVLDLDEARERARNAVAEMFAGRDPKKRRPSTGTLRAALDAYLAARKDLRPRSREGYGKDLDAHLKDWLDRPLREITADMVEDRHALVKGKVEKRHRTHQSNGNATANGVFRALRAVWNFAAERDPELGRNPVGRLRKQWYPVERRAGMVPADRLADFHRAILALPNDVARDYLLLLLFTGLRRGEAAALRWDDVDFGLGVLRLPAKRTKTGRKLDLPMTDIVRGVLAARRAIGRDASGFVFPANSESGHLEEPRFALRQVAKATALAAAKREGVRIGDEREVIPPEVIERWGVVITAHDLRRTFVTVAESTDISPLALKALVNHSYGDDVTAGYIVGSVERLRDPAQRVADRLKELCGIETSPIVGAP